MALTEAQERAVNKKGSLCVTAGAGTGKTTVLVERYIRLIDSVPSVKNILALTFTEKAAAEMKERVRSAISERKDEIGLKAKEDFNWASISTFHSFCASVLRSFPLEAEVDPGFAVLEDAEKQLLLDEAMDDLFFTENEEIKEPLVRAMTSATSWRLRQFLQMLYKKRSEAPRLFSQLLDGDPRAEWQRMIEQHRCDVARSFLQDAEAMAAVAELSRLAHRYAGNEDKGAQFLQAAAPFLDALAIRKETEPVCSALFSLSQTKGSVSMGNKKNFDARDLEQLRESYKMLKNALDFHAIGEELDLEDEEFISQVIEFLQDLRTSFRAFSDKVAHLKSERNAIDFDDMLIAVHRLFTTNKELVSEHFGSRYRYVLVDEMQDTDIVQLEIVKAIIGEGDRAKDRLFVVGDPKQSIYLFRGVDVTLFKHTSDFILQSLGGEPVNLDVSHRSTPQIIAFVNCVFEKLMPSASRPWDFRYEEMECSSARMMDNGSVELLLVPQDLGSIDRKMAEARMVASRISELVSSTDKGVYWDGRERRKEPRVPCYRDITILLRSRTNLRFYEHALRKSSIPYHVHAGLGFYNSQEVLDIFNILRFLHNRSDDIALYGVLRSPYFGLSDAEIFRFAYEGRGQLFSRLKASVANGGNEKLGRIKEMLEGWLEYSHREPIGALLARVISESSIYAVYGGMAGGDQMIANLEKIQDMARRIQQSGFMALSDFLRTLTDRIQAEVAEGEAQLDTESKNVVNIMTVHAAKGLEFPIVIVPELDAKSMKDSPYLRLDSEMGLGVRMPDARDMELRSTLAMKRIEAIMEEKEKAEKKRLFYVATTRAKDHLILTGQRKKEVEDPLERGTSWMDWLVGSLGILPEHEAQGLRKVTSAKGEEVLISIRIWNAEEQPTEDAQRSEYTVPDSLRTMKARLLSREEGQEDELALSPSHLGIWNMDEEAEFSEDKVDVDVGTSGLTMTSEQWGVIVHLVFQGRRANAVLREFGLSNDKLAEKLDRMYSDFLNCELMKNIVEERKEQPFSILIDGKLMEGRIDRMVKKADGRWIVIDYKSGAPDKEGIQQKKREYSKQMEVYTKAIKDILGCDVVAYLYFTDSSLFVEM